MHRGHLPYTDRSSAQLHQLQGPQSSTSSKKELLIPLSDLGNIWKSVLGAPLSFSGDEQFSCSDCLCPHSAEPDDELEDMQIRPKNSLSFSRPGWYMSVGACEDRASLIEYRAYATSLGVAVKSKNTQPQNGFFFSKKGSSCKVFGGGEKWKMLHPRQVTAGPALTPRCWFHQATHSLKVQ